MFSVRMMSKPLGVQDHCTAQLSTRNGRARRREIPCVLQLRGAAAAGSFRLHSDLSTLVSFLRRALRELKRFASHALDLLLSLQEVWY